MAARDQSLVLDRFEEVMDTIGRFRKSGTRFTFDREPEGGRDGSYRVEASGVATDRQLFGSSEHRRSVTGVDVMVAYFRGGGENADRIDINRRALDDMSQITDACEDPATYDEATTGIRAVRFESFSRLADLPRSEIWSTRFNVETESEVVTQ